MDRKTRIRELLGSATTKSETQPLRVKHEVSVRISVDLSKKTLSGNTLQQKKASLLGWYKKTPGVLSNMNIVVPAHKKAWAA